MLKRLAHNANMPVLAVASALTLAAASGASLADGGGGSGGSDDRYPFLSQPPVVPKQVEPRNTGPKVVDPKKKKKDEQKTEHEFLEGYKRAYALAHSGAYEAAFVAFKELDQDDHPDVANHLGFIRRKLGDYEGSKVWYERALASNPNHTRTWQYYGLWHLEQGNRLKAEDHLEKIRLICGPECRDYVLLKEALESGQGSH